MSMYDALPPSKPAPRRAKNDPIFGAGWRVYIDYPPSAAQPSGSVPLIDAEGKPVANDLADGDEVEIVSWRPRSREGLSYQIRRLSDGSEWWIAAAYLRRLRPPPPCLEPQ